ncbi:MAG TPA: SdpI family protein, partial [Flavisolibacter sp.]|nr:SdpI family protein [Flavisolibacter sp.]
SPTFGKLAAGMVVFISAINVIIIASAKGSFEIQRFLFPLLGLMFAFIGNYMNHIRPNYFAGIRLPWTLSSDENWRRTHQLAGKLWFAGGLLIVLISVFLPVKVMLPVFIGIIVIMTLIPVYYSYKLFRQQV